MAWQTLRYKLTGLAPLIMHNGQTADPLNSFSKKMKAISGKSKKTDADHEEMAKIEFAAGLYLDSNGPILPATVIEPTVINAAKKMKDGPKAKAGCFCLEHARLEYDGPRDPEKMWEDGRFRFTAAVRVSMSKVMRTRPRFEEWSTVVSLSIEDTLVNPSQVDQWMQIAGTQIGMCDWRPQFGRFTAERLNGI